MSLKPNFKASKKFIKNARNVLAPPKDSFWPIIEDDNIEFVKKIEEVLKNAKTFHPKLQWTEARKLSKIGRKNKIDNLIQSLPPHELQAHKRGMTLRKSLSLGVNDVARSLEKEELICCLISGEAKPKLLITHLIDLAKAKKIPILVLNSLKDNVKRSLGFSSLAVGFKKEILLDTSHDFHVLCNEMLEKFNAKYNYNLINADVKSESCRITFGPNVLFTTESEKKNKCSEVQLTLEDIYLFRESHDYRVFKPDESCENVKADDRQPEGGRMAVDCSEEEIGVVNKKARHCVPPTVFRVQTNPNKIRRNKKKKKT